MYRTKILLDSITEDGARLTTWELTYPRFVHAELMTHRVFSKNSASSRAIPVQKMIDRINDDPVIPIYWGKNQKGMQAEQELTEKEQKDAQSIWLAGRDNAMKTAEDLREIGVHKQIANRPLEAWMFITVILSATSFKNWFALRDHPSAQPEIAWVAKSMHAQYRDSKPQLLLEGEWHMPLLDDIDQLREEGFKLPALRKISVGRIARVSYLTHEGKRDPQADIDLAERLSGHRPPHMSPFEHVAQAMTAREWDIHVRSLMGECEVKGILFDPALVGNLVGWMQYRKVFQGEHGLFEEET